MLWITVLSGAVRHGWTDLAGSFIDTSMNATDDTVAGEDARHDGTNRGSRPGAPSLASLGGWRALINNPGLIINTLRHGGAVGQDALGNRYFEERRPTRPDGRARRWVLYAGRARDASLVPPEWHAWLHFTTDAPLSDANRRPWQRPHEPNLTGTAFAYRPKGHDYAGGARPHVSADYESWTPDA
jgi:NADH:ubiquinone oxidoreductase subunit